MSLRTPIIYLKNLHLKDKQLFYISSLFFSRGQFFNIPNKIQTFTSDNIENLQFPKSVQPLVHQSVEEILSVLNSKSLAVNESVSLLKALRMFTLFKNVKSDNFLSDSRFKSLCDAFEKDCRMMYPNLLVSGLRSLLEVGVPPNSSCVIAAEQSIIKNINMFSSFNLIGCLYFHHKFVETDLQKTVVMLLRNELCKKISEISSNAEMLMLFQFLHIFEGDNLKKLQQKIIERINMLNSHEICKAFCKLAENSNRNIFILNALAFHLRQHVDSLQIKEIVDILYSFKKLNFLDMLLVSNLLGKAAKEIPTIKQPSNISGILTVCGHLRLRHIAVLNLCADWIVSHIDISRIKEFVAFILTIANLNFFTLEAQRTLQAILPLITFEKITSPDVWLDVVWSLAILNITDKEMLLKVLSPAFYESLISDSNFQSATNKLKLMNLKAVLKNHYPECIFRCDLFLDPLEVPQSKEVQNNRQHLLKVLSNFVPKDKYLCTHQNTDMGIFIDSEFIMDKNLKPLPLTEFGMLSKVTDIKPLPPGAQRIALMILFFKDYTLCTSSRIGFINLAIKLLFSQGYTAVPVSFEEFMRNNTEIKKAKYLLQRISGIMQKVEDNGYKFDIKIFN